MDDYGEQLVTLSGGCHCQGVRFEAQVANPAEVQLCNCSICRMSGFEHLIVPANRFNLLKGEDLLRCYAFNSKIARHLFCGICGVKSFYVPRSNPDGFSLNVRCLEGLERLQMNCSDFDGRNWSRNAHALEHLSKNNTNPW